MPKTNFKAEHQAVLDDLLLEIPGVSSGVVFGLPCYKIHDRVFATLYGEGIGIKLSEARVRELLEKPGFVPFQPFGRSRGKQFVQINHAESADYRRDLGLFEESMRYVAPSSSLLMGEQLVEGEEAEQRFHFVAALLTGENHTVTMGKMMSSPGIQYRGKVFAFYYAGHMVFRLGRDFQPALFGIQHYTLLTPFKTKPPMLDWFKIASADSQQWEALARYALRHISETTPDK